MFGWFESFKSRQKKPKKWDAPGSWHTHEHMSTYERQQREANRHRMYLIRDRDLLL